MADDISVTGGSYTATIRTEDNAGVQLQIVGLSDTTGANVAAVDASGAVSVKATGAAADGAAVSGNPVLIAGSDGTNVQTVTTTTGGNVLNVPAIQTVTTTLTSATSVAVTLRGEDVSYIDVTNSGGGSEWTVELTVDGSTWFAALVFSRTVGTLVSLPTVLSTGKLIVPHRGAVGVRVRLTSYFVNVPVIITTSYRDSPVVPVYGYTGSALTPLMADSSGNTVIVGAAASGATKAGNPVLAGATYTSTQPTVTTGQAVDLQATARGALIVSLAGADNTATNGAYTKLTDGTNTAAVLATLLALKTDLSSVAGTATVTGGVNGLLATAGPTAVNASSTGNPVYAGGIAVVGANPTKATNGQRTGVATDAAGRLITTANHERTMTGVQQTTITSSTSETTIVTAVASTFCDITQLTITNSSATATLVTLKDATAGTTRGIYSIAAGGGITIPFSTPLAQAAVNNNWTITCGTSVASIYVVAQYVKNT